MLSADWLPAVPMKRVILHWTAGTYTPNSHDLRAYHFVIDGDGKWHKGVPVERNSGVLKSGYAAHTLNANTDAIGISLACMAGAVESPFNPGKYPMKPAQVASLLSGVRVIAERYGIPIERKTILSHAEVQPTLGIKQRQKWDYSRIPFMPEIRGAIEIGDWIRDSIRNAAPAEPPKPVPAGGVGIVTASSLNTRTSPSTSAPATGSLPKDTRVVIVGQDAPWLRVQTPAGYLVWVHSDYVDVIDGPPEGEDDVPDATVDDILHGDPWRADVERRLRMIEAKLTSA